MFKNCANIKKFKCMEIGKNIVITDMSEMFCKCNFLEKISNFGNLNTSNVIDMNNMFSGCEKLESLPDISKWNTE